MNIETILKRRIDFSETFFSKPHNILVCMEDGSYINYDLEDLSLSLQDNGETYGIKKNEINKDTYRTFIDTIEKWMRAKIRKYFINKLNINGEFVADTMCGDAYTQIYKVNNAFKIIPIDKWYYQIE